MNFISQVQFFVFFIGNFIEVVFFTIFKRLLKVYNISTEIVPEFRISNIICLCHNFIQL